MPSRSRVPLLRLAVATEWRDHGRFLTTLLGGGFLVGLAGGALLGIPRESLLPFVLGVLPALGCLAVPGSVVDDVASGFARALAATPVPRAAYALLRGIGLLGVLLPLLVALTLLASLIVADLETALSAIPLILPLLVWTVSLALLLGMAVNGPGIATALWVLLLGFTLASSYNGPAYAGGLGGAGHRLLHVLPIANALEVLAGAGDPWRFGALTLLVLETLLVASTVGAFAAWGWRAHGAFVRRGAATLALTLLLLASLTLAFPAARASPALVGVSP